MSQQINLYNPFFLKQEKYFSARAMLQALGLIALGLAALYGYALVETRASQRNAEQHRAQLAAQREQMVMLAQQLASHGRSKSLAAEVVLVEAEVKARQTTLQALGTGELGNPGGFSDFLAAFGRQALPGVWLTAFTIGESGNDLLVEGRALRPELVPAYLSALSREPMMKGRRVTEMKLAAKTALRTPTGADKGGRPATPERFVEFVLAAPRRLAEAPAKAPAR